MLLSVVLFIILSKVVVYNKSVFLVPCRNLQGNCPTQVSPWVDSAGFAGKGRFSAEVIDIVQ
jgi:hypothetical protein